jgi:hypothetical protein
VCAAVALIAAVVLLSGAPPALAASSQDHPYSRRALAGQAALAHMGPQGRAAANFAAQSAPRVAARYRGLSRSVSGGSTLGGVTKALSGSGGGMGFPMPLILIGTLVAAVGYAAWRSAAQERAG